MTTRRGTTVALQAGLESPAPGIVPREQGPGSPPHSVRWTGMLVPPETGRYGLGVLADGGVRLRLDGRTVLELGAPGDVDFHHATPHSAAVDLVRGREHRLQVDYVSPFILPASASLWWLTPSALAAATGAAAGAARSADAAVVVVQDVAGEGGHARAVGCLVTREVLRSRGRGAGATTVWPRVRSRRPT